MNFVPIQTGIFERKEGERENTLFSFFCMYFEKKIPENSILIISSKVVALDQNRVSELEISELIEQECRNSPENSQKVLRKTGDFFLTENDGIIIPNLGIDSSNAKAGIKILWPENPQQFADDFRTQLQNKYSVQNIGVVISDSRITPRRRGTTGVALAWSGISGVYDMRGKKDIYGRALEVSTVNIADNVVSGSEILMGQADEKTPFVLVENFPEKYFTEKQQSPASAIIPEEEDLFDV